MVLFGCRDEFPYTIPAEPGFQYNMFSELSPNTIVDVQLSENVSIGSNLENIDRSDAIVSFRGADVPGGVLPMAFNATSEKYHLVREDFRVKEGMRYDIEIIVPNENMDTISAFTEIPRAVGFSAEFLSKVQIPIDSTTSHHEIEIIITFDEPLNRPAYYRFVPYRLETIVRVNNGGIDVVNFGTKTLLEVAEVRTGANSVEFFDHREGVTIDESRLTQSQMHLLLKTIKPLKDGEAILAQEGKEFITRLHLDLYTLSQELFEHDQTIDLVDQGGSITIPAREINNIRNATGVFGGASRTTTFLDLN